MSAADPIPDIPDTNSLNRQNAKTASLIGTPAVQKSNNPYELTARGALVVRKRLTCGAEVFNCRFSLDDEYVAAACSDGTVKIFQSKTGQIVQNFTSPERAPCTNIRFVPQPDATKTRNLLAVSYVDGKIRHYHVTSGKLMHTLTEQPVKNRGGLPQSLAREDLQTLGLDYAQDGSRFATVGTDYIVRIYDPESYKLTEMLTGGINEEIMGHSNRAFSVQFHPQDTNILISGGWDNTVQFWDRRSGCSIRRIFGPHICGEALDFHPSGHQILTGSYTKRDNLQIWSFADGRLLQSIQWTPKDSNGTACMLYSASYSRPHANHTETSPNSPLIVAGGDVADEAKVFSSHGKCLGYVRGFPGAVYSTAISRDEKTMAVGSSSGELTLLDFDELNLTADFQH